MRREGCCSGTSGVVSAAAPGIGRIARCAEDVWAYVAEKVHGYFVWLFLLLLGSGCGVRFDFLPRWFRGETTDVVD